MLEIILLIVSILFTIRMLGKEEPEVEPSLIEIEEVKDSYQNNVYLVYYNKDFLMQDTNKDDLKVKLTNWIISRGIRLIEPEPAKR